MREWFQPWGHQRLVDSAVCVTLSRIELCGWWAGGRGGGVEGRAVDTGVKRTSLSTSSRAHPCRSVPCRSHRLDRTLKSPHIMIVSPRWSSISSPVPTFACGAGGKVYVCIDENRGFVIILWFFYSNALQFALVCGPLIQM